MNRSLRRLVAVSSDAERDELLEALLVDANDYDVVYMESPASAATRVRLAAPDLVVVMLNVDDAVACHLTATLKIECEHRGVALVTCASRSADKIFDDVVVMDNGNSYRRAALSMN
jgi:DNA-binding NarL/FixJ family response regulator